MAEKFCLKWHDFQTNIGKSFSTLRNNENFQDITLVSEDHVQISAHRVILTSCSGFFKNILSQNKHNQNDATQVIHIDFLR